MCAKYRRPAGVAFAFQVALYKVEPAFSNRRRNLLSKYDWRAALADEVEERWPEMALVRESASLTCGAEGLAGTGAGPKLHRFRYGSEA
jgi:hypothetical protein